MKKEHSIIENERSFETEAQEYRDIRLNDYGFAGKPEYFEKIREFYLKKYLSKYFTEHKRLNILDCGCGDSDIAEDTFKNHNFMGIDLSYGLLKVKKNTNQTLLQGNLLDIPFRKGTVDIITIINVIHHMPYEKLNILFEQLDYILNPTGIIFICEHNPFNPFSRLIFKLSSFDKNCRMFYPGNFNKLIKNTNLKVFNKEFILYFPELLKPLFFIEKYLNKLPMGAQYFLMLRK